MIKRSTRAGLALMTVALAMALPMMGSSAEAAPQPTHHDAGFASPLTCWDQAAPPWTDPPPTINEGMHDSENTDTVKRAQRILGVGPDGCFGPYTRKAVEQFQRERGLYPDGVVGPCTWKALLERDVPSGCLQRPQIGPATAGSQASRSETKVELPGGPTSTSGCNGDGVFRKGDSCADVGQLIQRPLITYGFLASGGDDNDFGPVTDSAVRCFQQLNRLTVDGIVGQNGETMQKLQGRSGVVTKGSCGNTSSPPSPPRSWDNEHTLDGFVVEGVKGSIKLLDQAFCGLRWFCN